MSQKPFIVFVCEHGTAKSIIAAAYFNKLAEEKKLTMRAIARGTHPDQELSQKTIDGLGQDGLHPTETNPKRLLWSEAQDAQRVVTFCELPIGYQDKAPIERWDTIPPVSEGYAKARDAMIEKIELLLENIDKEFP